MKKGKKKQPPVVEIVSLNEELFSLAFGNPAGELLDQRLALAVAGLEKLRLRHLHVRPVLRHMRRVRLFDLQDQLRRAGSRCRLSVALGSAGWGSPC